MAVLNPANVLLLGFPEYKVPATRLAKILDIPIMMVDVHQFPDHESRITLPEKLPEHLILCRSLDSPNDKLIELILTIETARTMGVRDVTLIAPYLCYMRQDMAFHSGEAISQKIIGELLAHHIDRLITVDPHLHRVKKLEQAVPVKMALTLHATSPIAEFLSDNLSNPLLLGPDNESRQWVKAIAKHRNLDYAVATKKRLNDREVCINLPDYPFKGREIVLVDDVASTGRTLEMAALALSKSKPKGIYVVVTHALISTDDCSRLYQAGISNIWSTDSVIHPSNRIELAALLSSGVEELFAND